MKNKLTLVLSLAVRGGGIIYAREIIHNSSTNFYVVSAKNTKVDPTRSDKYWLVHENIKQLVFYSIVYLPKYLLFIFLGLIRNKYSKLYLPNFHFWNLFFILLFRLFKKEVIYTVHDGVYRAKNSKVSIQSLENLNIKLANKLVFLTAYVKNKTVENLNLFNKKSYVVPHGIILPPGLAKQKRNWVSKPKILFFGRVLKSKGVEELIQALNFLQTDDYDKLLIVGKHYYKLKINNQKILVKDEFIADSEIAKYFNESNILVLPYQEASQSGVLTIGIGASIPMVVTKGSGLEEQLNDEEAIFVEKDAKSIQVGINCLIDNKDLYERISINLNKKQESLTWHSIANEIDNIINE